MNGLLIDNFSGGGGASTGIEQALGRPIDFAINHDDEALVMHRRNHPMTQHLNESVWDIKPKSLIRGRKIDLAWFSPDCTHFSRAKGSTPLKKNIRGLAWVVMKWAGLAKNLRPRVIMLENVQEFLDWGPLTKQGKPNKKLKGATFNVWVSQLRDIGYNVEWKVVIASDFGDPTIRKRLLLIARCDGLPIVWPDATHRDPKDDTLGLYTKWRTASEIIDFSIPAPSIFTRKRPLAENTCRRIANGLVKFVIDNPDPFIATVNFDNVTNTGDKLATPFISYGQHGGSSRSALRPMHTITASRKDTNQIIVPIIDRQFGNGRCNSVNRPLGTIMSEGQGKSALVSAFIAQHNTGAIGRDIQTPISTIMGRGTNQGFVNVEIEQREDHSNKVAAFLIQYYGTSCARDLKSPLPTITTKDRFALISARLKGWGIVDIGMRMLTNRELCSAQGFPETYDLCEDVLTKTSITKKIGNSVPPGLAKVHVEANLPRNAQMCEKWRQAA